MGNSEAWRTAPPNPTHDTADLQEFAAECGHPVICVDQQVTRRTRAHFAYLPGETRPFIERELVHLLRELAMLGYTQAVLLSDPLRRQTQAVYVTYRNRPPEGPNDGQG